MATKSKNPGNGRQVKNDQPPDAAKVEIGIGPILNHLIQNAVPFNRATWLDPHGRRNIDDECGYPRRGQIKISDYRYLYEREWIAKRVVDIHPDECWAEDPLVFEDEESRETTFEQAWNEISDEKNVFHFLHRVDRLSGVGEYGVLLLGLDDGKDLREPVDGIDEAGRKVGNASHKLLYLRAFDQENAQIGNYERNTSNPRFGQPLTYNLTFSDELGGSTQGVVHWSRAVHIADNRETSEVLGVPRLQSVYNRIWDLRKLFGGSAEMFWRGGFPGYVFEIDPEVIGDYSFDDAKKKAMKDEILQWGESLQRTLTGYGMKVTQLSPQVADPEKHVEAQIKAIAIAIGVPMRILQGTEAAHLASTQDKYTWNIRVRQRQSKYLTPMIVRPFVDRLMAFGILPEVDEYFVEWPDLLKLSDLEKAEVTGKMTEALSRYVIAGAEALVPPLEYFTTFMDLPLERAEAIVMAANEQITKEEEKEEPVETPPVEQPMEGEEDGFPE